MPEAVTCCSDGKNLLDVAGAEICDGEAVWPSTDNIGSISIDASCGVASSNFQYTITGPSADITDNCNSAVCDQDSCTFSAVDGNHSC